MLKLLIKKEKRSPNKRNSQKKNRTSFVNQLLRKMPLYTIIEANIDEIPLSGLEMLLKKLRKQVIQRNKNGATRKKEILQKCL